MASPDDFDELHRHIPRDADGAPIFCILSPGARHHYDEQMARCEYGWRATKHPGFIKEAQIWTHLLRQPPPLWLSEAVIVLAERRQGKGHITRMFGAAIRMMRYLAVRKAPKPGTYEVETGKRITWDDAYAHAAQVLAGTPARGTHATMKEAYRQVKKDVREGRLGLYYRPLPTPGRKLRDAKLRDVTFRSQYNCGIKQ
jgi:hypothetical protein